MQKADVDKPFIEPIKASTVYPPSVYVFDRKVRIVANKGGGFGHPLVRESSVLALSKFMCISEAFCERYLDLLFTTLEKATDTAVSVAL